MKTKLVTHLSHEQRRALEEHFAPALLQAAWLAPANGLVRLLMRFSSGVMLTWGDTIYTTEVDGTGTTEWLALVAHELKHVEQYRRLGKWRFAWRYLTEWVRHGYFNVSFEAEAYALQWRVEEDWA